MARAKGRVAREIGYSAASLLNWERGRAEPELRFLPAILAFLGYDPRPEEEALGARIRAKRISQCMTLRDLAAALGLDLSTVQTWEAATLLLIPAHSGRFTERARTRISLALSIPTLTISSRSG